MHILNEVELSRYVTIERVIRRDLLQKEAAEQLGLSCRQVRRLQREIEAHGAKGVKRCSQGGNRRHKGPFKDAVLYAVRKDYVDFGPTFASEKLAERDGLHINKETLRQWMIEAGLWKGKARKSRSPHQSRHRRFRYGELVQIDGSYHDWFEGRGETCCLIVMIDDATSRLQYMGFEHAETTLGYFRGVRSYVQIHGRPMAFYSDKHSIFKTSRPNKGDGHYKDTQFQRAMRSLGIELICAHSPQAKGRVERAHKTLQDRLMKEMRLRGISTREEANAYLPEFIEAYNKKFAVSPQDACDAHRDLIHAPEALNMVLSLHIPRKLSKNLETSYEGRIYQIQRPGGGYRYRHASVMMHEHMDGRVQISHGSEVLDYKTMEPDLKPTQVMDRTQLKSVLDQHMAQQAV